MLPLYCVHCGWESVSKIILRFLDFGDGMVTSKELSLVQFITGTCTYYRYLHLLQVHALITGTCAYYRYLHSLQVHALITGTCTYYRYMHLLQVLALITGTCTHYRYLHWLQVPALITGTCTHYRYLRWLIFLQNREDDNYFEASRDIPIF